MTLSSRTVAFFFLWRIHASAMRLRDGGAWRRLTAAGMTKEAALLSVAVAKSTICRISFVCAQARIEAE